jgi:2',3'-cyclic-nucleotide 2'-phosphodiesterase (5'-nucleotidase family)
MRLYGDGSDIALCPTGSLNRSAVYLKGSVTRGELGLLIDHNNRLSFIRMPGRDIVKALETGVSFLKPVNRNGTLILTTVSPLVLQSSGIAMQVNLSREGGNRLSNVRVLNGTKYEPIDPDREYRVIVNTRIGQFDEGYKIFQNEPPGNINNTDIRILDTVMNYMADRSPGQNPVPALTATA